MTLRTLVVLLEQITNAALISTFVDMLNRAACSLLAQNKHARMKFSRFSQRVIYDSLDLLQRKAMVGCDAR